MIDGRSFFDQTIKMISKKYDNIATGPVMITQVDVY